MSFWDGQRWQRLSPPPRTSTRPNRWRDLLATLVMVAGVFAVVLPMVQSRAAEPAIYLNPTEASVGMTVQVTGADLVPQTVIQLQFDGSSVGLPRVTSSASGEIHANFKVPRVAAGTHTVTARTSARSGRTSRRRAGAVQASATLIVTSPVATPTATPGSVVRLGAPNVETVETASPSPSPTPDPTAEPTQRPTATPPPVAPPAPPANTGGVPAIPSGGTVLFNAATGSLGQLRPETYPNDHPGDGMIACGLFTADPAYFPISGGALHLRTQLVGGKWVQTFLTTRTTYAQKYGIFRAALQWDNGYQLWPSFWLYDPKWSAAEIDAVENHPDPNQPNDWGFNMHPGTYNRGLTAPANHTNTWHVYELEWRADFVAVRLDGVEKYRYTSGSPSVPLWVGFDMKLGTPWENKCPDSSTPSRAELRVAWLQVAP